MQPSADLPIRELLTRFPGAIPVFLRNHMNCVGCDMSAFDTLRDAAAEYDLEVDWLLGEIRAAVSAPKNPASHIGNDPA